MTTPSSRNIRLVDAAERLLLESSDADVLREAGAQAELAHAQVASILKPQLQGSVKTTPLKTPSSKRASSTNSGAGAGVLVSYLRKLAQSKPQLSPNLSAAFSSKQTPDQIDIERLAVELLKKKIDK
ncbi:MAG: hypothetical protein EKK47_06090 [Burkholderiales bacterium]|nr:MAG: hypothetical protein EKK47_06090 [Burkholderiales bacterium]